MTSRDFCYWLQGFFEISDSETLSPRQLEVIKNHLSMVFVHELDPSMGAKEHRQQLNSIYSGLETLELRQEHLDKSRC